MKILYPVEWEEEFKANQLVSAWLADFPDTFDEKYGWFEKWGNAGTL